MSLIDEEPRSAAAVAAEDTLLLILTQESFAQILHTYHALGVKLLMKITRMVSQRLRSTSGMLTDALESTGEQEFLRITSSVEQKRLFSLRSEDRIAHLWLIEAGEV